MRRSRATPLNLVLSAACLAAFLVGGHMAAGRLIGQAQQRQLTELSRVALRRSEASVDSGVAALAEMVMEGGVNCGATALQSVRLHVYQHGFIKDVRIVGPDAAIRCSAYSETLEFDQGWTTREAMLTAADPTIRLFRIDQFFGVALGLMKDTGPDQSLVAVLGINGSMLDIMPTDIRASSEVVLQLNDGKVIARNGPEDIATDGGFSSAQISDRYPLRAVVRVSAAGLRHWNNEPYWPVMSIFGVLGLIFATLNFRMARRAPSPIDALDRAIALHEFQPYLQPLFDLDSQAIVGAEVLARWVKPDGTVAPPSRFIELAESSGRIDAITWYLLSTALNQLQPAMKADKTFKLAVNITPSQFVGPDFVAMLRRTVSETGVSARQITLELTERETFDDLQMAAERVAEVRRYGFRVAIDDVGIGHSGLSQIQRLGADTIKVDKFFVDGIERDASAATIIQMLVRLARDMHMSVVAEGIETEGQVKALRNCGVSCGQGYLVSPPVPVEAFLALIGSREAAGEPIPVPESAAA